MSTFPRSVLIAMLVGSLAPLAHADAPAPAGVSPEWLDAAKREALASRPPGVPALPPVAPAAALSLPTTATWINEGNEILGLRGQSVSTVGDINGDGYSDFAIGAPLEDFGDAGDAGKVYVWYGGPNGPGNTFSPSWTGKGGLFGLNFGWSVAPAGDVNGDGFGDMIVGAPQAGSGQKACVFLGSASGFHLPSNTPALNADWKASGAGTFNGAGEFGWSVAGAGDVNGDGFDDVIVGEPNWSVNSGSTLQGRAFGWLGRPDFGSVANGTSDDGTAANAAFNFQGVNPGDRFGYSVATGGDLNGDGFDDVLVGAPDWGLGNLIGRAYVFVGSSAASPLSLSQELGGASTGARTGYSVAFAGDLNGDGYSDVLVGSPGFNGGRGRVAVLLGRATAPFLTFLTNLDGTNAGDSLGWSVASAGDVNGDGYADIVLGGPAYVFNGSRTGVAQMFYGGPGGLRSFTPAWATAGDPYPPVSQVAAYGWSVATAGDVDGDGFSDLLVGSPRYGQSEWGRAYYFKGGPDVPAKLAWETTGHAANDVYGWSVAFVGDVNGDTYDDVLVGAPAWTNTAAGEGAVFAYYGSATGLPTTPSRTYYGGVAGANLGISVAGAGDLNGDGYADVVCGAHVYNGHGAALVWYGSLSGLPASAPAWITQGNTPNGYYGASVAGVGDLNGDGFGDIAVGAPNENWGLAEQGRVCVFLGGSGGLSATPSRQLFGEHATDHFGGSVSWAGDVNRDGLSDLVVGAPGTDSVATDAGRAYVFNGIAASGAVNPAPYWRHDGRSAGATFGAVVAHAGDVNNDGFSDILVGAPYDNNQGRVEAYYGGPFGLPADPSWALDSPQFAAGFGASIASAGDQNLDGYSDVMIGAVFFDGTGGQDCGRASVYLGGPGGLTATPWWSIDGLRPFDNIGHAIAGGGDLNGDGYADLLFGMPGYDGPLASASRTGGAWAATGNGGLGLPRIVDQIQSCSFICLFRTVFPMGMAASPGFTMAMRAQSPKGRDRLRARTTLASVTQTFATGATTSVSPYMDSGTGNSQVGIGASCPGALSPCHWRIRVEAHSPYFPRTPWFSLMGNAASEADVRMSLPILATGPRAVPTALALSIAGANPSRGPSTLTFALPHAAMAEVVVRDVQGRRVRTLTSGWRPAGEHEARWDANDEAGSPVAAGVYFVQLAAGGQRVARAITIVR